MGAWAWAGVMYPRTQSPPAHPIPHLALGSSTSTTTRLDRRRAHPGTTGTYLGQRGTEVQWPPSHPHTAAQAGCVTAMFPWSSPTGTWEVFLSRSWPRQITAAQGSCGYSGTNARGTSGPRTWARTRPPTADALPPPSLASHLRQGMAGRGRALTDRLTPLQHAFWPSFCRNGQSWNGLPRRAHHGHNYKCPPSHLSLLAFSLCSIIRPNIIETIQLFLPHKLSNICQRYKYNTPTHNPT